MSKAPLPVSRETDGFIAIEHCMNLANPTRRPVEFDPCEFAMFRDQEPKKTPAWNRFYNLSAVSPNFIGRQCIESPK